MSIGLLDFCLLEPYRSSRHALVSAVELARTAEEHNWSRYWLGEHHEKGASHTSPEALLAAIGTATHRIRIGTGSILMRYWNLYKLCQCFRVYESLYPGRVELGVSLSRSTPIPHKLLSTHSPIDTLTDEEMVNTLGNLLYSDELRYLGRPTNAVPHLWMTGGERTLKIAAAAGAHFVLDALCTTLDKVRARDLIAEYNATFVPNTSNASPLCGIGLGLACATSDSKARSASEGFAALYSNTPIKSACSGSTERCADWLRLLVSETGTSTLLILPTMVDLAARKHLVTSLGDVIEGYANHQTGSEALEQR